MPKAALAPRQRSDERTEDLLQWYRTHGPWVESFDAQRAAVEGLREPNEAWQCDRRAGKTSAVFLAFHRDGTERDSDYVYIAKTRRGAKDIVWREAKKFKRRYSLGWQFFEQELRVVQPQGSQLQLYGADNPDWVDRLHGRKLRGIFIDEAAFWKIDLRFLIEEVLDPCRTDEEGFIRLMSRPGHINRGFFYDVCHLREPGWRLRKWSWRDNPYVAPQMRRKLARDVAENPEIENQPAFRRNYFNEWIAESGNRIYLFEEERNGIEAWETQPGDQIVIGVDFGFHDATAFSVLTWSERSEKLVELDSYKEAGLLLDHIAARLRTYLELYPQAVIVGDPARTQYVQELRKRHGIPIQDAEKINKRDWIDTLNADLSIGRVLCVDPRQSPHVEEMQDLHWETLRTGRMIESHNRPNDCCDAFLYAYRHAHHYLYGEATSKPTDEQDMERDAEQEAARRDDPWTL